MRSTAQLRQDWGPACQSAGMVRLPLHGAGVISVDRRTVDAWEALNAILRHHDYKTRKADTGSYACRRITGGSGYSLHAYPGVATDINWTTNPYSTRLITDIPDGVFVDSRKVRTRGGKRLFRLGRDFVNVKDAMHWEIVVTPAELAKGIDWTTVPGYARGLPQDGYEFGDSDGPGGQAIAFLQAMLNILAEGGARIGPTGLPGRAIKVDGNFGAETRSAVGEFQMFNRAMQEYAGVAQDNLMVVDGRATRSTMSAIGFWVPGILESKK